MSDSTIAEQERQRLLKMLRGYLALTQEPNLDGYTEVNEEWDRGFEAAIALIDNPYNSRGLYK